MTYDEHTKVQPVTTGDSLPEDRPEITSISQVMSGAEILLRSLEAEGVKIIFGHPGGAVIKVYDEMHRINPEFQHILVRHEQGGTHAAEGYAKATGKVGTVLVTSGPDATNTVTGIADAYMDSVPIVVFTGQVPTGLIGNDAFQECDAVGITRSITKHSYLVRDIKDLARTVREAYHIARVPDFGGHLCHRGTGVGFSGKVNTTTSLSEKGFQGFMQCVGYGQSVVPCLKRTVCRGSFCPTAW